MFAFRDLPFPSACKERRSTKDFYLFLMIVEIILFLKDEKLILHYIKGKGRHFSLDLILLPTHAILIHRDFNYIFLNLLESHCPTIGLSLPEIIAVQSSQEIFPHTAVYFIAATKLIHHILKSSLGKLFVKDDAFPVQSIFGTYGFGYYLCKLTWSLKIEIQTYFKFHTRSMESIKPKKIPEIRRCSMYNKVNLPTYKEFVQRQNYKVLLLLVTSFNVGNKKKLSESKMSTVWNDFRTKYSSVSPNIGSLHSSHVVSILSKIGLMHYNFHEYMELDPYSRPIASLKQIFGIEHVLKSKEDHQQLLKMISKRHDVGLFTAENMICKSYRICNLMMKQKKEKKGMASLEKMDLLILLSRKVLL